MVDTAVFIANTLAEDIITEVASTGDTIEEDETICMIDITVDPLTVIELIDLPEDIVINCY